MHRAINAVALRRLVAAPTTIIATRCSNVTQLVAPACASRPFSAASSASIDYQASAGLSVGGFSASANASATLAGFGGPARIRNSTVSPSGGASGASVDADEIKKFNAMASSWWDPRGVARPLHRLNPCRVQYIASAVRRHFARTHPRLTAGQPLHGLDVLDVGCGPGLLAESLARLGGRVHGIDAAASSIAMARQHAQQDPLLAAGGGRLAYSCVTAESLLASPQQYDVVCALEIVEHVTHPPSFVNTIAALVKPGGLLIMSTISKTTKSYLLTILAAEYVLRWVPVGTHDWSKFITPTALSALITDSCHPANTPFRNYDNRPQAHTPSMPKIARAESDSTPSSSSSSSATSPAAGTHPHSSTLGFHVSHVSGMIYDPVRDSWRLDDHDTDVNYILVAERQPANQQADQPQQHPQPQQPTPQP